MIPLSILQVVVLVMELELCFGVWWKGGRGGAWEALHMVGTDSSEGAAGRGRSKVSETLARKHGSAGRSTGIETMQH
jgi:hypothetical protein